MNECPLLDITIDAQPGGGAQVRLRFDDPASGVAPNEVSGDFALPAQWPDAANQPESHGKALNDALLSNPAVLEEFLRALNTTIAARVPRPLRIQLRLPPKIEEPDAAGNWLHDLSWETLLDPRDEQPLLSLSNVYFARFLPGGEAAGDVLRGRIRALVTIANPPKLAKGTSQIRPVEVDQELKRARQGLGSLVARELYSLAGRPGEVSLTRLIETLKEGEPYQILYMVCHGAIREDKSLLWLDEVDDAEVPILAERLVKALRDMDATQRPRLVVLASCQSAGNYSNDKGMLAALGPKLVQEGKILAVVAMHGDVFMPTVEAFMPQFFRELAKDGQVERAMAAARSYVRTSPPEEAVRKQWRVPVLFSRLKTGQVWPDRRSIGDVWAHRASKTKLIYIAHDTCGTPKDSLVFDYLVSHLETEGFEVLTDRCHRDIGRLLESKLFAELSRCDGAVVLLNQKAVAGDSWVLDEARVLRWRSRLEKGFPLVFLCLDSACREALKQDPWRSVGTTGAPEVPSGTRDEVCEFLKKQLNSLLGATGVPSRLTQLEAKVTGYLQTLPNDIVQPIATTLLPEPDGEDVTLAPSQQLARALLCRGPELLVGIWEMVAGSLTGDVVKQLAGLIGPAWVDIRAVSFIPEIIASTGVDKQAFAVNGSPNLAPGVGKMYLQRACGLGAVPWTAVEVSEKQLRDGFLKDVREGLVNAHFQKQRAALALLGISLETQSAVSDEQIKEKVEKNPTVVVLPATLLEKDNHLLLQQILTKYGPLVAFFPAAEPNAASQAGVRTLEPLIRDRADERALDAIGVVLKPLT